MPNIAIVKFEKLIIGWHHNYYKLVANLPVAFLPSGYSDIMNLVGTFPDGKLDNQPIITYIGGTNNIFAEINIMCIGGYYIGNENQKIYMPKISTVDLF